MSPPVQKQSRCIHKYEDMQNDFKDVFMNFEKMRDNEITQAFTGKEGEKPSSQGLSKQIELNFLSHVESSRKWSNVLKCEGKNKLSKLKF